MFQHDRSVWNTCVGCSWDIIVVPGWLSSPQGLGCCTWWINKFLQPCFGEFCVQIVVSSVKALWLWNCLMGEFSNCWELVKAYWLWSCLIGEFFTTKIQLRFFLLWSKCYILVSYNPAWCYSEVGGEYEPTAGGHSPGIWNNLHWPWWLHQWEHLLGDIQQWIYTTSVQWNNC